VSSFVEKHYFPEDQICVQGNEIEYCYVMNAGVLNVTEKKTRYGNDENVGTYEKGKVWGQISLLHAAKSPLTIKAETDATIWTLSRHMFDTIRRDYWIARRSYYFDFLSGVGIFQSKLF